MAVFECDVVAYSLDLYFAGVSFYVRHEEDAF